MYTSGGPLVAIEVARLLSVLADPTRLRLVRLLLRHELCVCELVDALRIPQYKVSRHLSRLRRVGLVEARRNGRWMYYSVGRRVGLDGLHHDLLKLIDVHMNRTPEADRDDSRLARRLGLRQGGRCVKGATCC
jgi:ArsR family transcriptional regulator